MPLPRCLCVGLLALFGAGSAIAQRPAGPRPAFTFVDDLQYAEAARDPRRNRLDLYVPQQVKKPPIVLFVHGGAWTGGGKDNWGQLAQAMCARGYAFAPINTQLNPFAEPSDMVADVGRALRWLHDHAADHGCDGERLWLMGHSSGAHLVTWLALDDERLRATGVPRSFVQGVVGLSGVYEVRTHNPALDSVFGTDPKVRLDASPFAHASPNDPPALLLWGEHDLGGLALCGRMLQQALHDAGVPCDARELPGADHAQYVFRLGQPGDPVLDTVCGFLRRPRAAVPVPGRGGDIRQNDARIAGALPCKFVQPVDPVAKVGFAWVASDANERELAGSLVGPLVRRGVAVAIVDGSGADERGVAATFRLLRSQSTAVGFVSPSFLGGIGRGGMLVAAAPLGTGDGLRGRVVLGSPLGPRSLPSGAESRTAHDFAGILGAGDGRKPGLLMACGDGDPKAMRDESLHVALLAIGRKVDVHLIDLPGGDTATVVARAGHEGDLLLPLLRAFLVP
ncbi:MAG: alpha/beta hydrolase [Planctomycetes bacterium]|nr:alpha/beta hydrolase [Planctomycetota bacterium]